MKVQRINFNEQSYINTNKGKASASFSAKKISPQLIKTSMPDELFIRTMDNAYRGELLKSLGLSRYNQYLISPIMGPYETKRVIAKLGLDKQHFIASPENLDSGKFQANLHIHTTASDGYYTPEKLLQDSVEYADKLWEKVKEPFVIAVTDHDTIGSYERIIKEIYSNPYKYKHLKVILGMESTTYETVNNKPIQFHMLVYNINPNDDKFNTFLKKQGEKKQQLGEYVINDINKNYKNFFKENKDLLSADEFTNYYTLMKNHILSTHNYIRNYALTKFMIDKVITKSEYFNKYFNATNPEKNINIEMKKLKDFEYKLSHNNKGYTPIVSLQEFYSKELNTTPQKISQEILKSAQKHQDIMKFIELMNTKLLEHRNINGQNFYVNIDEVYEALSEQPNTMLGIAHPLSTVLDRTPSDKNFDCFANVLYNANSSNKSHPHNLTPEFLQQFYSRFKEAGKEKAGFSETFYQSYNTKQQEAMNNVEVQKFFDNFSNDNNLYKTGGYDSHRENIFARY